MREALLHAPKSICIERARWVTEFHEREGFDRERPVLRQARALAYVLDRLPTPIFGDECIVGSTTRHRLGTLIFPEFMSMVVWPELPTISTRAFDPVQVSQDDADHLAQVVFPAWRDRTVHESARRQSDNARSLQLQERLVFYVLAKSNGITHIIPDYGRVVREGLLAVIERAAEREAAAEDAEATEYHQAVQLCLAAVIRFAGRYADAAESAAGDQPPQRARELRHIAEILRRVPAQPAATLHEAIQAIWILQVALHQENSNQALSFGRLDQILADLYDADLEAGRLDDQGATELIGCFFIKMGDHTPLLPETGQEMIGGASTDQAVTLGGLRSDGTDGVNALTMCMLDVASMLALREPNVCARVHRGSSPEYVGALVQAIHKTGAAPALYGDEAVVTALQAHGVSLEDARNYGVIGCVEPTSCGNTMGMTGALLLNLAAVLELTLYDGIHPLSGLRIGPATGELHELRSFDRFHRAFTAQLESLVLLAVDGNRWLTDAHAELHPTPLLSSLVQGTEDSGRDVTRGGARYNSSGVAIIGFADTVDSLVALRTVVFEEGLVSLTELQSALASDFEDHPRVHALLSGRAPKYGNDNPAADGVAVSLVEQLSELFARQAHPRGGRYHVGYWSVTMHAGFGALTGPLPNGRRRGASLASGATPVSGVAKRGPTAAFLSTCALPAHHIGNGIANNHKLSKSLLGAQGNLAVFQQLVSGYFGGGGMQVQFTVCDRETLLAAQADPDSHRDLLVRVSGYTAYFCDLNRRMQDEIIGRTEDLL